ncbi:MAG TPA: hypothetical protein DG753_13165 [Clostridium sp.]|nr:hypothetical protein [Clostridium sp.]
MDFDGKREQLLKEAYNIEKNQIFSQDYKRRFFSLIQDVILFLLEKDDSFFGQFMLKIKRNIKIDIKVPVATIPKRDGFNMYFNPYLFLQCSKKEMAAILKHEIYHIINSHFYRERELKKRFNKEAVSVAMDIAINQYIKDLPLYYRKLDNVNMEYNLDLKENRSIEEYAEKIYESIKSRIKKNDKSYEDSNDHEIDMTESHEIWDKIDLKEEDIKSLTKKTAISSYNKNAPEGIEKIILSYSKKPEIPWQKVLKNLLPSVKYGYKKTTTRRNRRQPERMELRGLLPKFETEIVVAIDISASIKENDLRKILIEILSITANTKNKITVIECDNEIRRVYKLRSERDILKRSSDNGSTKFSPVFKYMVENNIRNSILIYFTDGVGEKELEIKPINKKTIWVISGNEELSLKESYGEVKHINAEEHEVLGGNTALQMLNEVIHDWAR